MPHSQPLLAPLPCVLQVFEFLSTDLKKFMDRTGRGPLNPLPPMLVKVRHAVHCTGSLQLADVDRVFVAASVSSTRLTQITPGAAPSYSFTKEHDSLISLPGGSCKLEKSCRDIGAILLQVLHKR